MTEYKISHQAAKDLKNLKKQYPDIEIRFLRLIGEVCEKGYELPQTGKPEPLKRNWAGFWSKRLTDSDRIIYKIAKGFDDSGNVVNFVEVVSCKGHYNDK